ncbi:hypothetical protein [uncultured Varibaculum sp.]|uniref:hypothetical protein n=1 Tax=uncultured Varibaculum sp. TaxID=413896 RepID=UPI002583498D|nr:hypothetical protein [uncultured Varibaculum sp.]
MKIQGHWRQALGTLIKTVGIGIATALIAISLLVLVNSFPTGRVAGHVAESMPMYLHEGDYPNEIPGSPGSQRDNFTEAIMLTMAIYPSQDAPLDNTIVSHRLTGSPSSTVDTPRVQNLNYALSHLGNSAYISQAGDYTRYWHGYLVVLKPLLLVLNPAEIRYLNLVLQLVLVGLTCLLITRTTTPKMLLPVLATYVFLNPVATALSFQYYSIFYCTVIGVLAILIGHVYFQRYRLWPAFFLVLGMAVSFLDFLTYPVLALGIPLLVYVLVCKESNLYKVVGNSVVWSVGYVGFWGLKWVLAALFANQPLSNVKEYIYFRLDSSGRGADLANRFSFNRLDGIKNNLAEVTQSSPLTLLLFLSLLLLGALLTLKIVRFDKFSAFTMGKNICIIVVAIYPLLWYLVILNHSAIHSFFTYRGLGISVCAALILGLQFMSRDYSRTVSGFGSAV